MSDVTFSYRSGNKTINLTLKWAERKPSREALGIWQVNTNRAWKVYAQKSQLNNLKEDYARAAVDAGLPMGKPSFQEGTVKQGTSPATQGFALITEWMTGTNFQKTTARFDSALSQQAIPKNKTATDYKRFASYMWHFRIVSCDSLFI
jgi:hypothetical protein